MAETMTTVEPVAVERPLQMYRAGDSKSIFIVFMELFFSRWMLICGIFFTAIVWSYLTLAQAPDTYEASAQLLIRRGKLQATQGVPIMRQQEEIGSEVDILLSIAVLEETVNQLLANAKAVTETDTGDRAPQEPPKIFGIYDRTRPASSLSIRDIPLTDPAALRKYLRGQMQIRKFGESNVIEVAMVQVNPVFAAEAVNTVVDVYEKFNMQVDKGTGQAAYYRAEIDRLDNEIDALQNTLADYMTAHGVANVEKERELLTLRRHSALIELDKLQQEKVAFEVDLRASENPATRLEAAFLRKDQAIMRLREAIFSRENEIAELRSKSTDDNPLVKQKIDELTELRHNLESEIDLTIAQQRHLYRQLLDKERELQTKVTQFDAQVGTFPRMMADIDRLDRDIKQRTIKRIDVVEQMVKASTLENPDEAMNKVKVLGFSHVPSMAREARKGFKFLVAVVLSVIAAFVAAIFVEGLDHSIRKREEIEEQLRVPYLASVSSHLR